MLLLGREDEELLLERVVVVLELEALGREVDVVELLVVVVALLGALLCEALLWCVALGLEVVEVVGLAVEEVVDFCVVVVVVVVAGREVPATEGRAVVVVVGVVVVDLLGRGGLLPEGLLLLLLLEVGRTVALVGRLLLLITPLVLEPATLVLAVVVGAGREVVGWTLLEITLGTSFPGVYLSV